MDEKGKSLLSTTGSFSYSSLTILLAARVHPVDSGLHHFSNVLICPNATSFLQKHSVGVTGFEPASPKSLIYSQVSQPIAQHSQILNILCKIRTYIMLINNIYIPLFNIFKAILSYSMCTPLH